MICPSPGRPLAAPASPARSEVIAASAIPWFVLVLCPLAIGLALIGLRAVSVQRRDSAWASLLSKTIWDEAAFDRGLTEMLPPAAQSYLSYCLLPGVPLRNVAIAETLVVGAGGEQTISHSIVAAPHGWIRRSYGTWLRIPVSSTEGVAEGRMIFDRWLLRVVPFFSSRQCPPAQAMLDRMALEAILWTPAALLGPDARWLTISEGITRVRLGMAAEEIDVELSIAPDGRPFRARALRSGLIAEWVEWVEQHGRRLPVLITFSSPALDGTSAVERVRLTALRFADPWRGGSHA